MEQIGAFYQCYQRIPCVDFVLSNFRKHYDSSTVVLISDGGMDFDEIAQKYHCIYNKEERIATKSNLVFESNSQLLQYALRIQRATNLIKEDFFIILEDDVVVFKPVTYKDLVFDINGCNFNEKLDDRIHSFLSFYNPKVQEITKLYYGGCGGSILRTSFFRKILSENLESNVNEFFYQSSNVASDTFLSFLCWKYQGSIGTFNGFCETWYEDYQLRKQKEDIEVLHQFKDLY